MCYPHDGILSGHRKKQGTRSKLDEPLRYSIKKEARPQSPHIIFHTKVHNNLSRLKWINGLIKLGGLGRSGERDTAG